MKIRELVKYLEVEELTPFHFYTELNKIEYSKCKHMTDEELNDYLNNTWTSQKVYDNSELGVYLPDINVDEYYFLEKKRNPVAIDKVIEDISFIFPVKLVEGRLIFIIYVILHEVGHWLNFKASGKTSLEYTLWDSKYRREPEKLGNKIYQMPDNSFEKWELAKVQVNMYKNIPSEKAADVYAYENIKEKLELVKKYIGLSN